MRNTNMKTGTPLIKASVERPLWPILILLAFALGCFALLSHLEAVVPPPDGGYSGNNTAEGQNALFSLTTGVGNTAVGAYSLGSDTTGHHNTAVGTAALRSNTTAIANTAVGYAALYGNTSGLGNTATGFWALTSNITGAY